MIDRTIVPEFHPVTHIEFMKPQAQRWNQTPVWVFHQPGSGVYRMEIIFKAGEKYQHMPLLARAVAAQLSEGAGALNSKQFSALMDKNGVSVQVETEKDFLSVSVYGLTENADKICTAVTAMLTDAHFPEEGLQLYVDRSIQRLNINRQKVDVLAREKFAEVVYGSQSTYGKIIEEADWKNITTANLRAYYEQRIKNQPFEIVVSGDCPADFLKKWETAFQSVKTGEPASDAQLKTVFTPGKYRVPKTDALQNAIIISRPVINRSHPDFPMLQMVNLVLGGYFGSRLMSNIREDKGYTYGIGSGIRITNDHAYLSISTEVGSDVCDAALTEIYKEIHRLTSEKVENDELKLARNYMLGSFIRNSDGALAMADRFKSVHFAGLDYSYYDHYLQVINTATSEQLLQCAQTYLPTNDMVEIVAGK